MLWTKRESEVIVAVQRTFRQVVWVLFLALLLLGVPRIAGIVADMIDYSRIDPDGAFGWLTVHHIVQALIFLVFMVAIEKGSDIGFGFGPGDSKVGLFYLRVFMLVFTAYLAVNRIIMLLLTGSMPIFWHPLNARNIVGHLGFQLLLSGPSEELIFRAFAITMIGLVVKGKVFDRDTGIGKAIVNMFGGKITVANLIAALVFGLAHVRFTFAPFSLSYETGQVVVSIILGLYYGVCYERSKSMVYPMVMHSFVNILVVSLAIIAGYVIG